MALQVTGTSSIPVLGDWLWLEPLFNSLLKRTFLFSKGLHIIKESACFYNPDNYIKSGFLYSLLALFLNYLQGNKTGVCSPAHFLDKHSC